MKLQLHTPLLAVVAASALVLTPGTSSFAQVEGPPATVDYQGEVLDGDGAPLAPSQPENFTMQFRIWTTQQSGDAGETLIWAEQQVVTVSNGLFSVRLGAGQPIPATPTATGSLANAFDGNARFLGVTVVIPGQSPGEIQPRLAFLTSPFSFVAGRAVIAETVAAGAISDANISSGAVRSVQILDGTIAKVDLAASAVDSTTIEDGTVELDDLAANSVDSSKIANGEIKREDIADNAVDSNKIADFSITLSDLSANSVNSNKIVDGSVGSDDIKDGSITATDFAPTVGTWGRRGNGELYNTTNVGIGNTDPRYRLDVTGDTNTTGDLTVGGRLSAAYPFVHIVDRKAAGTDAGTFASGAWRTRDLTNELTDTHSICGFIPSTDIFTLPAGTYQCDISAPAYRVQENAARLWDTTNDMTVLMGTVEYAGDRDDLAATRSHIIGQFTLTSSTNLQIQHRCQKSFSSHGYGRALPSGWSELGFFTNVCIWKVK